jgi:uncharacterized protein (TIGR00269 family)
MRVIPCDRCEGGAVYTRRSSGQRLCGTHFLSSFRERVRKGILREGRLRRGERIGVAVSGGKDSLATLHLLQEFSGDLSLSLEVLTVDEGIEGYRPLGVERVRRYCSRRGLSLHLLSFRDLFGRTLDEMVRQDGEKPPCSTCGVLRRRALNGKARELGLDRLATGHNLDDEIQTILMNYLRGDVERLLRLGRRTRKDGLVPRFRPLREVPEREVALYALLQGLPVGFEECPYSRRAFRNDVRAFLNRLERENPGIKYSLLRGYEKILPSLEGYRGKPIGLCSRCGEPSSGEVCQVCELLKAARAGPSPILRDR